MKQDWTSGLCPYIRKTASLFGEEIGNAKANYVIRHVTVLRWAFSRCHCQKGCNKASVSAVSTITKLIAFDDLGKEE